MTKNLAVTELNGGGGCWLRFYFWVSVYLGVVCSCFFGRCLSFACVWGSVWSFLAEWGPVGLVWFGGVLPLSGGTSVVCLCVRSLGWSSRQNGVRLGGFLDMLLFWHISSFLPSSSSSCEFRRVHLFSKFFFFLLFLDFYVIVYSFAV